jgi:hypothetical protein
MKFSPYLALFMVLLLLWAEGFLVYHVASLLIHMLLVAAVISLIVHVVRGRSRK